MEDEYVFTSESVSEGHPDKVCDQISDSLVDLYLEHDPLSHVAIETLATTDKVVIAGEVRSTYTAKNDDIENLVRNVVKEIGYNQEGFDYRTFRFFNFTHSQSPDIAMGVDSSATKDEGAGDQGMMFGYATNELDGSEFMPAPLYLSHKILKNLADARHAGKIPDILPDSKSQVTIKYVNGKPIKTEAIVVSTQHTENISAADVKEIVRPYVLKSLPEGWMCNDDDFLVNPTGRFVIGGPNGDTGVTGRKIIVDTYGGAAPHGGGAFSGKDPTKVDRSAAYMARYLAKNVVAAELADQCEIQLSYAIGVAKPLSFYVYTNNTAKVEEKKIAKVLCDIVDMTPHGIRTRLQLNKPIYRKTASYGHFGRKPESDGHFSWEKTDLVSELRSYFKI